MTALKRHGMKFLCVGTHGTVVGFGIEVFLSIRIYLCEISH